VRRDINAYELSVPYTVWGQVSKRFYNVFTSHAVWIVLLRELKARNFIDLTPGLTLERLSQPQMVDLVKRLVQGPRCFHEHLLPSLSSQSILSPLKSLPLIGSFFGDSGPSKPIATHSLTITPRRVHNRPHYYGTLLLPGGEFILLNNREGGRFECWSVPENKCLWKYKSPRKDVYVASFSADMHDSGTKCNIILGLVTVDPDTREKYVFPLFDSCLVSRKSFLSASSRSYLSTYKAWSPYL
jgi:hypothetical protein